MAKIKHKGQVIINNAIVAKTLFQKMRGLIFRKKAVPIWLEFEEEGVWVIHSCFVAFPFDAVFIGRNGKAVDIFENINPFNLRIEPKNSCKAILELPKGTVRKFKISKGDSISVL